MPDADALIDGALGAEPENPHADVEPDPVSPHADAEPEPENPHAGAEPDPAAGAGAAPVAASTLGDPRPLDDLPALDDLPPLGTDPWAAGTERRGSRAARLAPVLVVAAGVASGLIAFLGVAAITGHHDQAAAAVESVPGAGSPVPPPIPFDSAAPSVEDGSPTDPEAPVTSVDPGTATREYGLRVGIGGSGTGIVRSTPSGLACASRAESCAAPFGEGTVVVIEAIGQGGSVVGSWAGCDSVSGPTCAITMTQGHSVTVTFVALGTPSPPPSPAPTATARPRPFHTPDPSATRAPGRTLDPGADTDGDSFPNEMEEQYGSDALDAASTPEQAMFLTLDNVRTCEDGVDNDLDGDFDAADAGCR